MFPPFDAERGLAQVLLEKLKGAAVGKVGSWPIVVFAAMAAEGVIHARVLVDRDSGIVGQAGGDLCLSLFRHELVFFGDMQHDGAVKARSLVQMPFNADAIVANRGCGLGAATG